MIISNIPVIPLLNQLNSCSTFSKYVVGLLINWFNQTTDIDYHSLLALTFPLVLVVR